MHKIKANVAKERRKRTGETAPGQRRKLVQQVAHQDSGAPVCRILQRNRLPARTAGAVSVGRF